MSDFSLVWLRLTSVLCHALRALQACNETHLQRELRRADPAGIGAPSIWAVRLARVRALPLMTLALVFLAVPLVGVGWPVVVVLLPPRLLRCCGVALSAWSLTLAHLSWSLCSSLQRLLAWHPERRISAEQALQHAYFVGPHK